MEARPICGIRPALVVPWFSYGVGPRDREHAGWAVLSPLLGGRTLRRCVMLLRVAIQTRAPILKNRQA